MVKAILHIDDRSINLLHFEYEIRKTTDYQGLPYGKGGLIGLTLSVEATSDTTWWQYAISDHMKFDKAIIELCPAILGQQKTRYINIFDVYVIDFKSRFNAINNRPLLESFFITAQGMEQSHSTTVYSTLFRKTFGIETDAAVVRTETQEPVALEGYYTTTAGALIANDELQVGTQVYYVLKTQHAVGKHIDLDLADTKNDFKHNGQLLVNDILEDFKVTADTQKIKLEVIRQTT